MSVIGDIYAALDDDELYRLVPELIAQEANARSCTLKFRHPKTNLEEIAAHYFTEEMAQFYAQNNMIQFDAWENAVRLAEDSWGRVLRTSDYQSTDEYLSSFYYHEFIRRFGDDSAHCIAFSDYGPDGGEVLVGLHRGLNAPDFSDEEIARVEALRPHLTRMAALRQRLRQAEIEADLAAGGLNTMADAILVLTRFGQIKFANPSAEDLLATGDPLAFRHGRVKAADAMDDQRFLAMLQSAFERQGECGGAMSLKSAGDEYRLHVSPHLLGEKTFALVLIDRPEISQDAAPRLQAIYDLTAAEAKVAVAAAEGLSATEISESFEITVPTVRTHLQRIFRKMDVTKASQLARLVATLPGFRQHPDGQP